MFAFCFLFMMDYILMRRNKLIFKAAKMNAVDSYNHLPSPLFDFILNTEQDIRYKLLMQMRPSELWYSVSWELRRSPTTTATCCYAPSLLLSTNGCRCLSRFR